MLICQAMGQALELKGTIGQDGGFPFAAFEPNPRNFQRCCENVALNRLGNVHVFNRGVSECDGEIELVYDPLMPGAGPGNPKVSSQIGSTVKSARRVRVGVVSLDDDIRRNNLAAPDFIKVDVEGMEFPALMGMRETVSSFRPALYIELHGAQPADKWKNARDVVSLVEGWGYRVFDVERGANIDSKTMTGPLPPSHIYCTAQRD